MYTNVRCGGEGARCGIIRLSLMSSSFRRPGDPTAAEMGGPDEEEGATQLVSRPPLEGEPAEATARRAQYRIGRRLGAGGFAEVYEAEQAGDTPGSPRRVALKRLLPSMRGDPMRRRHLQREAQLAIHLQHPNIVRVLELVDLGGELAIAMELVEGLSASHLLHRLAQRSQRLSLGTIAHIMHGLLQALGHLQNPPMLARRPLVHADISLENVMLTTHGEVKLVDFGIAGLDASAPGPGDDEEGLTSIHQVAGKRSYAPPEGPRTAPTVTSDLYAAGVCFWELCAGCRFPVLPPGVGAREMGSLITFAAEGLPEPVWTTLRLCLSIDPASRPGNAAQASALLQDIGLGSPFKPPALGHLVRDLLGLEPRPAPGQNLAASEPTDLAAALLERLLYAFSAQRTLAYEPVGPEEIEHMGGHEFILRAERGPGEPLPDYVLREALDQGFHREEDGTLLFRVRLPGAQPHVVVLQPAPGCVYDALAQRLLRSLLCPEVP
jgi:serine/threonine protein kinase